MQTEEFTQEVELNINGQTHRRVVDTRTLLVDFIRREIGLTGTHVGCDTTQCGACTIHLNGIAVKSCTVFAAQASGSTVATIEGLSAGETLHPVQQAFHDHHGLQCGYCTPGMVMMSIDIINREADLTDEVVRHNLEGNLCRCTGYHNIVKAIQAAGEVMRKSPAAE